MLEGRVQFEEALLELGIQGAMGQGQAIPGVSLGESPQCTAGVADGPERLGIIAPGEGSRVLDEPFEAVAVAGHLEIRLGGVGLASQAEGLAKAGQRVAVVGIGGHRHAVMADRRSAIAPGQCQAAAERLQGGVIGRAFSQEPGGCLDLAAIE